MLSKKKITVVGAGHMGTALIDGILRAGLAQPSQITASRRSEEALNDLRQKRRVHALADNKKAVAGADVVILAVKPQNAGLVLSEIAPAIKPSQLVITLMAGVTIEAVSKLLRSDCPVVRAMPNTPAQVDAAATAIAGGPGVTDKHMALAEQIFGSVGLVVRLPEAAMDAVTGLSGTGPVYVFMMIEAMIDGGVKVGIPRDVAAKLSAQTVFGAAKLVMESRKHPAILKDEVTTPAGTAINAIHELESKGLRSVLIDAIVTATKRSQELSRLYED